MRSQNCTVAISALAAVKPERSGTAAQRTTERQWRKPKLFFRISSLCCCNWAPQGILFSATKVSSQTRRCIHSRQQRTDNQSNYFHWFFITWSIKYFITTNTILFASSEDKKDAGMSTFFFFLNRTPRDVDLLTASFPPPVEIHLNDFFLDSNHITSGIGWLKQKSPHCSEASAFCSKALSHLSGVR